ncbi:MAG: CHRD domain-containing protein [Candidatus Eisenbacteria bacterium]|nr:CHRD domain-containing protein [Candidatus Eisenbacteria bacterium]
MRRLLLSFSICLLLSGWAGAALALPDFYEAALTSEQEVPPNDSPGYGVCSITLVDENTITFRLEFADLTSQAVAAHIHLGYAGQNGPVLYPLSEVPFDSPIEGTIDFDPQYLDELESQGLYVNIHTVNYPNGEIRGQICHFPVATEETSWGKVRSLYR